jgi:iron complex transport system substrate-binding protein
MRLTRRHFSCGAAAVLAGASLSQRAHAARNFTDSAGRSVPLPDRIATVFAAGGPAAAALYVMRPEAMVGWPRALRDEEKPYVVPGVRELPEVGLLTGRGDTANVERVLQIKPDLILDFGSVRATFASLADSVQGRTGISYALIDGRFEATAGAFRKLGDLLGAPERGASLARYTEVLLQRVDSALASVPARKRPRVYLARGPDGMETALRGSINSEIIERAGGSNVADGGDQRRGIANVSAEQLLVWNPDVVITWDRNFHARIADGKDAVWRDVKAVREGRVYLAPTAPFGWIDRPPSVNRLMGLAWLAHLFHGAAFAFDIHADTRAFYKLFYQVDLTDADLARLVAWADGRPPNLDAQPAAKR